MSYQKTPLDYELRTDFSCYEEVWKQLGLGTELYESQDPITVKYGSKVIWWWRTERQHQQIKEETQKLVEIFGETTKKPEEFTRDKMSPERLVKAFITHVLKLPMNRQTKRYGDRYYYLVKSRPNLLEMDELAQVQKSDRVYRFNYELLGDAVQWHYLYLAPDPMNYVVELDIKSAYFTAFLSQPTMLLNDPGVPRKLCFIGDGGAMNKLREINPELPNWFRFRMLEIIGSHELEYYQFNAETGLKEKKVFSFWGD